ncbi:putative Endothelin-converting enzyme 2-like protein, partial [Naja naja]
VGFRKGDGLLLSRLGSQIQLKLVFWVISLFVAVLLLNPSHTTCLTEACVIVAGKILEALDPVVKPCDDFYQYAAVDGSSGTRCQMGAPKNATFNSSSEAERKTQRYYLSCLREQKIEELGSQPLIDLIEKIGGWNVTGSWNQTNFMDILKLVSATYRASPFFTVF